MSVSVSSLVRYLKNRLDSDDKLQSIQVTGELSNFHRHNSGHLYFTLKDDKSQISCVMFYSRATSLKFDPKNGDMVEVNANVSIFETSGQLQLYVNAMKLQGLGDLYQQFEELKIKLSNEGYFKDEHKKEIPCLYPNRIAVIVGDKSAAMSDIETCFLRRWPICKVDFYPCLVQGKDAPKDIIEKLLNIDHLDYQIIILARGGGSFEDLFCFNDEELVKTIYNLNTFVITGIGHEQDYTLADFVADLRAPTPTATVELVTPNIIEVKEDLNSKSEYIHSLINNLINRKKMELDYYDTKLNNYSSKVNSMIQNIENTKSHMKIVLMNILNSYQNKYKNIDEHRLQFLIRNIYLNNRNQYNSLNKLLSAYSIDNTLKRGYSLVYKDNILIKNSNEIDIHDDIDIRLYGGNIKAIVKEKQDGKRS